MIVDQVTAGYGPEPVLDHLTLPLETGATTAVVGVSGCGKTTLLRVLAGLVTPTSGAVRDVPDRVGYVLQSLGLFPWKTVIQNIDLGLESLNLDPAPRRRRVDEALADFDLSPLADRYPRELSGGQAQRVALARALVRRPELLLLDEPTSSLDALAREAFQDWLREVHRRHPCTLVTVTHGIEEAAVLGDQVVVLHRGAPPTTLASPLGRVPDPRNHPAFGPFCQTIRRTLAGGGA